MPSVEYFELGSEVLITGMGEHDGRIGKVPHYFDGLVGRQLELSIETELHIAFFTSSPG
jgi:hypothetical protein